MYKTKKIIMIQRNQYVVQPYNVGPKDRKSLVVGIPASVAKEYQIDRNTIFILKPENDGRLILHRIINQKVQENKENLMSADKSSEGSSQQTSGQVQ